MKLKTTKINDKILAVEFKNQKDLVLTMFRIAEFYESPFEDIKGKYFTTEQWLEKYAFKKYGDKGESYFEYWNGFNIPFEYFCKFVVNCSLHSDLNLLEEELYLLIIKEYNLFKKKNLYIKYIIFYIKGDKNTLKHELTHAYYYTIPEYKKEVDDFLTKSYNKGYYNLNKVIVAYRKELRKFGYCKEVLNDEINAYMVAFDIKEQSTMFKITRGGDRVFLKRELQKIYKKYCK